MVPAPAIEAAPCLHSCDRFWPGHWPSWLSQRSRRCRSGQATCPMTRRARLQNMSPQQRTELAEALKQFDLQLTPDQQKSIREIDQQISKLSAEDKVHYLAALRRYHNWLDSLPETVRDNLQAKPPGERMAQIKTMISRYPLPRESSPYWMQFAEVAGSSPFELATTFKIWQELTPQQRREIEGLPAGAQRRLKLIEYGRELKLQGDPAARFPCRRLDSQGRGQDRRHSVLRSRAQERRRQGRKAAIAKAEPSKRKNEGKEQASRDRFATHAPAGNQPVLSGTAAATPGRSAAPRPVLRGNAAVGPHFLRFLHGRRGQAPLDSGLPAALPQGRVQARAAWDVGVDRLGCLQRQPHPPAARAGCTKKRDDRPEAPPAPASSPF